MRDIKIINYFTKYFFYVCAIMCAFWLPEYYVHSVVQNQSGYYTGLFRMDAIAAIICIVCAALLARVLWLSLGLLLFLALLQLSQLGYFTYFGTFYSQYSLHYLFSEWRDFFSGVKGLSGLLWPTLVVCFIATMLICALGYKYNKNSDRKNNVCWNMPAILVLVAMIIPFFQAFETKNDFKPSPKQLSIRNGLYSWNYFLATLLKTQNIPVYSPYKIQYQQPLVDNLILIIGESANPYRMSLFGAKRDTTPFLRTLLGREDFHAQLALASSVATQYALAYFFNGVHEPQNMHQMNSKKTNLFKLASEREFDLHFISNQVEGTQSHSYRYGIFETWLDKDLLDASWGHYDDKLLDIYFKRRMPTQRRQFLVLHMKNMHMTYAENYPENFRPFESHSQDAKDQLRTDYDNALRYFDRTLECWLNLLKTALEGRTLVVYVPDHSEKLGENGQFGHGHLDFDTAVIPMFAFNLKGAEEALMIFRQSPECLTSHYQLHQNLARVLGATTENPNQTEMDRYFINGLSLYGHAGWLEGRLSAHSALCQRPLRRLASENR